jgi:hypothetical protein
MTSPGYTAEASLDTNGHHYANAIRSGSGIADSVVAQQLCRHLGQSCGGIDLVCCAGLKCTAPLGGQGICVHQRSLYHCSPCNEGYQICCPPPGYGLRCFIRACGGGPAL